MPADDDEWLCYACNDLAGERALTSNRVRRAGCASANRPCGLSIEDDTFRRSSSPNRQARDRWLAAHVADIECECLTHLESVHDQKRNKCVEARIERGGD